MYNCIIEERFDDVRLLEIMHHLSTPSHLANGHVIWDLGMAIYLVLTPLLASQSTNPS